MSRKRKLTEKELEDYTNMSDSEWETFLADNSDIDGNYESSDSSSQVDHSESEPEADEILQQSISPNEIISWSQVEKEPPMFDFLENPGMRFDCTDLTIETLVNIFFSNDFMNLLVEQTNLYANQEIEKHRQITKSSRLSRWRDVDASEMKVFLGLLLHMGPCMLPSIEHYWSTDILYKTSFWRSNMSRNRFQMILRFLHFADNSMDTDDRLYKIRPILNHFNTTMHQRYVPDKSLSINESMVLWCGRLFFRQYIKNRKHKYGIKLYELCESNGIVLKIKIYSGKTEISTKMGHASDIVFELMEDYLDKGYMVFTDNFYNSVALTKALTDRKTYICGTLKSNRKGNSKDLVNIKLKKGEIAWTRHESVVLCKWKNKRDVLTISNMHKVEYVGVTNRNGKISIKPNIVRDYNKGMSGVDKSDQMLSYYSALRKTIRWPTKMFLHIVEMYIHNAFLLYRKITQAEIKTFKFRERFMTQLIGDKKTNEKNPPSRSTKNFHYLEPISPTEKKSRPTKPCRVCTAGKHRRESRYFCPVCEEKPALCVEECFRKYHV